MTHNKKQFGVWMDSHHASIVGNVDSEEFTVVGHVKNPGASANSSESASNNQEIALTHKFFKEILSHIPNVDEIHVTGTGQIQEEFIKFMADTPQYKNVKSTQCTTNKMSDEKLIEHITKEFN
jgi:hypothetical protein